jgi:outer membrane lipoprotein-sorting protein
VTARPLIIWTVGAAVLAFTPSAPEILTKMATTLEKVDAVQARVVRERPDGEVIEEALLTLPVKSGTFKGSGEILDLSYPLVSLPTEKLSRLLPGIYSEDAHVSLGRFEGKVCYILSGSNERLWVTKGDLTPRKIEILGAGRLGTLYLYLDMVQLSPKIPYPSRTEVWRGEELILVERLIPASASTREP